MNLINDNLNILNIINDDSSYDEYKKEETKEINKKENINYNNDKKDLYFSFNNVNKPKLSNDIKLNDIKYGIDENGNPVKISEYFKGLNNDNKRKTRLIAYIKKEGKSNELIDLNGNKIITKNKEGDYEYPFLLNVIIKDFDVQHPELRINGERKYSNNINNNIFMKNNDIIDTIYLDDNDNTRKINKTFLLKENIMKKIKAKYINNNNINNIKNKFYKSNHQTKKRLNNISLNKINSISNLYFRNDEEIISRTNTILNMNRSNNKMKNNSLSNYNLSNNNLNTNNKKSHLYNIKKLKIPINRHYIPKNGCDTPRIKIDDISNININNFHFKDSINLNCNEKFNGNFVVKMNENIVNNKNMNISSFDIKNQNKAKGNYSEIQNKINNSKDKEKKIFIKTKKYLKKLEYMNNIKYLNNNNSNQNTILLNKYFTNFNTENNLNEKILNKLRLKQKISSFIRTIESPKKKVIKTRNENDKLIKFYNPKTNNNKNSRLYYKFFPKKKITIFNSF